MPSIVFHFAHFHSHSHSEFFCSPLYVTKSVPVPKAIAYSSYMIRTLGLSSSLNLRHGNSLCWNIIDRRNEKHFTITCIESLLYIIVKYYVKTSIESLSTLTSVGTSRNGWNFCESMRLCRIQIIFYIESWRKRQHRKSER